VLNVLVVVVVVVVVAAHGMVGPDNSKHDWLY
jgi:hypothetical protein